MALWYAPLIGGFLLLSLLLLPSVVSPDYRTVVAPWSVQMLTASFRAVAQNTNSFLGISVGGDRPRCSSKRTSITISRWCRISQRLLAAGDWRRRHQPGASDGTPISAGNGGRPVEGRMKSVPRLYTQLHAKGFASSYGRSTGAMIKKSGTGICCAHRDTQSPQS